MPHGRGRCGGTEDPRTVSLTGALINPQLSPGPGNIRKSIGRSSSPWHGARARTVEKRDLGQLVPGAGACTLSLILGKKGSPRNV